MNIIPSALQSVGLKYTARLLSITPLATQLNYIFAFRRSWFWIIWLMFDASLCLTRKPSFCFLLCVMEDFLFCTVSQCQRAAGRSRQASRSSVPGNESADSGGIMETAGVELKSPHRKLHFS